MNQTKKRLSIINLAISIGDIETIQLQMLRLAPLKNDQKIQGILQELQAENYAQTQALITSYIESPDTGIHQRTMEKEEEPTPEETEAIIEEFDLFTLPDDEKEEVREIGTFDEILDLEPFVAAPSPTTAYQQPKRDDLDALLNLTSEEIQTNKVDLSYSSRQQEDDFFKTDEANEEEQEKKQDDFFTVEEENSLHTETPVITDNTHDEKEETSDPLRYETIPYIDQKLKNMLAQYPPLVKTEGSFASVERWLHKIAHEGYSEEEIESTITHIQQLVHKGELAEAALLLLVSAATQSKFAQFMLARALFKGDLIERNLPESFTIINRLAMDDDYPEAICDLGQLYENGIGIDKDKEKAEALYKEAMEMGIKRAKVHYERLRKQNRGLFSFLKK